VAATITPVATAELVLSNAPKGSGSQFARQPKFNVKSVRRNLTEIRFLGNIFLKNLLTHLSRFGYKAPLSSLNPLEDAGITNDKIF